MRILKFGGTSVATAERIAGVAKIVASSREEDRRLVVVSALAGVTDQLERLITRAVEGPPEATSTINALSERHLGVLREITGNGRTAAGRLIERRLEELRRLLTGVSLIGRCPGETGDRILATGERLSAPLVAAALECRGVPTEVVDGTELIEAERCPGDARIVVDATRRRTTERLSKLPPGTIAVVPGFIARDASGEVITLGRGASDLSATVLGTTLECDLVEIWTDVDGILDGPPRFIPGARTIPRIGRRQAARLAHFGAEVLHPACLEALGDRDTPVVVRNTLNPTGPSTVIERDDVPGMSGIAAIGKVAVLIVETGPGRAPVLYDDGSPTVAATVAGERWVLVIREGEAERRFADLVRQFGETAVERRRGALLACVGTPERGISAAAEVLQALTGRGVAVEGFFSDGDAGVFSVLMQRTSLVAALNAAHEALRSGTKPKQAKEERHERTKDRRNSRRDRRRRSTTRRPAA